MDVESALARFCGASPEIGTSGEKPREKVRVTRLRWGSTSRWVTDRIGVAAESGRGRHGGSGARGNHAHHRHADRFDDAIGGPHGIAVCWNPVDDDLSRSRGGVRAGRRVCAGRLEQDETKFSCIARGVTPCADDDAGTAGRDGWTIECDGTN